MSITGAMLISTQGMAAQGRSLDAIAANTANVSTPGYQRLPSSTSTTMPGANGTPPATVAADPSSTGTSNVDLQTEVTGMVEAKAGFAANASAFETGADMWDMLMSMKRD